MPSSARAAPSTVSVVKLSTIAGLVKHRVGLPEPARDKTSTGFWGWLGGVLWNWVYRVDEATTAMVSIYSGQMRQGMNGVFIGA